MTEFEPKPEPRKFVPDEWLRKDIKTLEIFEVDSSYLNSIEGLCLEEDTNIEGAPQSD